MNRDSESYRSNQSPEGNGADSRLEREARFHDHSYSTDLRTARVEKFYQTARESYRRYDQAVLEKPAGKNVLEYGCGTGSSAFDLAKAGASVHGIDISPVAIKQAQQTALDRGVANQTEFRVMNAEELKFEDSSFDLVCGIGILHHLDLKAALPELRRVLKPGGLAVFHEPLGHNPLINWYRRRTPELRTEDEHPLMMSDIDQARALFPSVAVEYFHLLSIGASFLDGTPLFRPVLAVASVADRALMKLLPPLRRHAWFAVIRMAVR